MLIETIHHALSIAKERKWKKMYWAIDIHGTILEPNYKYGNLPKKFFEGAKETLQELTNRPEICLILYTCSHPSEIVGYLQFFAGHNIYFEYVNQNPEVTTASYGYYVDKLYFNVLLEDKAGFNPATDWDIIQKWLTNTNTTLLQQ